MPFFLLIPILVVMAVVCLIAAILAIVLLVVTAVTGLSVLFVLHKFGYDRRLMAYFADRGGVSPRVKVRVDDLDIPVTSVWSFEDRRPRPPE